MNFSQAQVACEDRLANLASVVDGYEEGFVETLLFQNNLESAWIGLNDMKVSCNVLSFVDNRDVGF